MKTDPTMCAGCAVQKREVSRRDFVSMATMSAVAVALTACGGGGADDPVGPGTPGTGTVAITLSSFPELATIGNVAKVRNSPPVAMARTSTGLVAFSMFCTHQGTLVGINSDNTIRCPNHGATFTSAGVWTGGQRTTNLVRLPLVLDAAGTTATVTLG